MFRFNFGKTFKIEFDNGDIYIGEMAKANSCMVGKQDTKISGHGTMLYNPTQSLNIAKYVGGWAVPFESGRDTCYFNTDSLYHGKGKLTFSHGSPTGMPLLGYYDSIPTGSGRVGSNIFPSKGIVSYNGMWHLGRRQGKGHQVYLDGSEYRGMFHDDEFHGYGIFKPGDGSKKVVGIWDDGKIVAKETQFMNPLRLNQK